MARHQQANGDNRERGQVTLVAVAVVGVALAVLLALGRVGQVVVQRAKAAAAADAVALAAVTAGPAAARAVAGDNGAVVVSIDVRPGWARATVRTGVEQATATAALVELDPAAERT